MPLAVPVLATLAITLTGSPGDTLSADSAALLTMMLDMGTGPCCVIAVPLPCTDDPCEPVLIKVTGVRKVKFAALVPVPPGVVTATMPVAPPPTVAVI